MYWAAKLLDLALGGVALGLGTDVGHVRRTAQARLADANPLRAISANHDLLRALRIAWVRAALDVLDHALLCARAPQARAEADELERFDDLARPALRALRSAAFNRSAHPGDSVVDAALLPVLDGSTGALALDGRSGAMAVDALFAPALAALAHWPVAEIPPRVLQVAVQGVPLPGHRGAEGVLRPFGELVFAEFADLIKDPKKYPQASIAFQNALAEGARELAGRTLGLAQGIDAKLDQALAGVDALQALRQGLVDEAQQLQALRSEMAQVPAQTVQLLMDRLHGDGALTGIDQRTLISLAQRLTTDEVRDVDRAVRELQHAVELAAGVVAPTARQSDDRFVEALRQRVAERTRAGDIDAAVDLLDDALADLQRQEDEMRAALRRSRLAVLDAAVQQELLRRDAYAAARRLEARAAVQDAQRPAQSAALRERAEAFFREGVDRGLGLSLQVARELERRAIEHAEYAGERAAAEGRLAEVLLAIGDREVDDASLAEAVALRRAQVDRLADGADGVLGRAARHGLAHALQLLGTRRGDEAMLQQALALQREVLLQTRREDDPGAWADAQGVLGRVLYTLGARRSDAALLQAAAVAFGQALEVRTRAAAPQRWARLQATLGIALGMLARIDGSQVTRQRAIAAFREVLKEFSRERTPIEWARAQNNLGIELLMLGQQAADAALLEQAAAALRASLSVYDDDNRPVLWAMAQHNLGGTLIELGGLRKDPELFEQAVTALRLAARHFDREHSPVYWSAAHSDLANALALAGRHRQSLSMLLEAERCARAAIDVRRQSGSVLELAVSDINLGEVLLVRAELFADALAGRAALDCFDRALAQLSAERMPVDHQIACDRRERALVALAAIPPTGGPPVST